MCQNENVGIFRVLRLIRWDFDSSTVKCGVCERGKNPRKFCILKRFTSSDFQIWSLHLWKYFPYKNTLFQTEHQNF